MQELCDSVRERLKVRPEWGRLEAAELELVLRAVAGESVEQSALAMGVSAQRLYQVRVLACRALGVRPFNAIIPLAAHDVEALLSVVPQ